MTDRTTPAREFAPESTPLLDLDVCPDGEPSPVSARILPFRRPAPVRPPVNTWVVDEPLPID